MATTRIATSQDLSSVELAWLRVSTPESPSVNTVALIVDGALDAAELKERIEDRLLPIERFRQRLESRSLPLARPRWQDYEDFQLTEHLFSMEPLAKGEVRSLGALVDRVLSLPMDESRPLWQAHLLRLGRSRSAIILRVHAVIADSRASAALALRLVDEPSDEMPTTDIGIERRLPLHELLEAQKGTATATRMLVQLISSRADRENPFRQPATRVRSAGWSTPVPLTRLEQSAKGHGCTPTDLLLSAVAAAMRRAAHRQDRPADSLEVRALVPLDLRRTGDAPIGTRSALGLLRLPVDESTDAERIGAVRRELERLSTRPENLAILGLDASQSLSMTEIEERAIRLISHKATAALAMLDGPVEPQSLCGKTVSQLVWWPALNKKKALGISVVAYAGEIRFGVSCDEALQIDAATLAADMAAAITPR